MQQTLFELGPKKRKPVSVSRQIFGALCVVCDVDWRQLTTSERGRFNRAARELKEVGATPDDIAVRSEIFKHQYDVRLTPTALSANWAALAPIQG